MARKPGKGPSPPSRLPQQGGLGAFSLLLLLAGGCVPRSAPAPPPARSSPDLQVALTFAPRPARQMDPTTFTVQARDRRGRPVAGAAVIIDLTMPAMAMGKNQVTATPKAPGTYIGTGRFTMAGDWRATVTTTKNGAKAVQSFAISVQ